MSSATNAPLPQEVVDRYRADGIVVLGGAFREWVAPLRAGIDRLMADPSPRERTYRPRDGSAPFFQDYCNWQRIPEFRAFVHESPAAALAARLMESRTARFFHDHVLVKEPGTSVPTPWHQAQPYYCVEGSQSVSFWIALDPVARDTVPEYVAGSHRWGRDYRPLRFDEWEERAKQRIYVSATPAQYELEACGGVVVEQIIRPTGILDPDAALASDSPRDLKLVLCGGDRCEQRSFRVGAGESGRC